MRCILTTLVAVIVAGCTARVRQVENVYQSRERLLSLFEKISLFRNDRNLIILSTYIGTKKNTYLLNEGIHGYQLTLRNISFQPDTVAINQNSANKKDDYDSMLIGKVNGLVRVLDSLEISSVSHEFQEFGIALKVYFKGHQVLIYVPHVESVHNNEWGAYIKSMNGLDHYWYYSLEEK
jgi:hypothetical protein